MEIKSTVNPVGSIIADAGVDKFIDILKKLWDETKPNVRWWQFWKRFDFSVITNFLIKSLDDLVAYFIERSIPGADKKATVMAAVGKLYDYIIQGVLPFYLRPFSGVLRKYVIDGAINAAIDWLVEKYQNGTWRPKTTEEISAQWTELHAQMFGVPGGHRPQV